MDYDFELDSCSLSDLFAAADAIGDKYLTKEEIAKREAALKEAQADLRKAIADCESDGK